MPAATTLLALLLASPGGTASPLFTEGPRRASGNRPWLAHSGDLLAVCWDAPTVAGPDACFSRLPLPPTSSGRGPALRVRFADPDTLELLDADDELFRWGRGGASWVDTDPPRSAGEAALMRSTLFFEGLAEPCSHHGELVPRPTSEGDWSWAARGCPRPCAGSSRGPTQWPRRPGPSLRVYASATGTRSQRTQLNWPDEEATRSVSSAHAVVVGLSLGLGSQSLGRPVQARANASNASPPSGTLLADEETAALAAIQCPGVQP